MTSESGFDTSACLRRVRQQDATAARALIEHLNPLVRKIVLSHLPRGAAPEDLCQDAFVKVFSRLDQYAGEVPLEHWVARVTLNTCRDALRSQARSREVRWSDLDENQAAVLEAAATQDLGGDESQALAAREIVEKILADLPAEDRLVLTMIDLEQKTAADVRAVTGWSITGIRVRAFRARRKLRKILARLERPSLS